MRLPTHMILLDTNVWMALYFSERDGFETAQLLVDAAQKAGYQLLYAVQSIKDVFYQSNRYFKRAIRAEEGFLSEQGAMASREMAWGIIENMRMIATAVGSDNGDVALATKLKRVNGDFEDNLIMAAAERSNADFLVTWDKELLSKAFGATATPEAMLEAIRFKERDSA